MSGAPYLVVNIAGADFCPMATGLELDGPSPSRFTWWLWDPTRRTRTIGAGGRGGSWGIKNTKHSLRLGPHQTVFGRLGAAHTARYSVVWAVG